MSIARIRFRSLTNLSGGPLIDCFSTHTPPILVKDGPDSGSALMSVVSSGTFAAPFDSFRREKLVLD
jgi:hypothetical protein